MENNQIEAAVSAPSKSNDKSLDGNAPFVRTPELDISRFYMGSLMTLLSSGNDTGGRSGLMIYNAKPGNEPPPHIHEYEDEFYYVLEGIMEFFCDGKVIIARPGDYVFLPKGKAHAFFIRSPHLKTLLGIYATENHPVGLDQFFYEMSGPAESMSLPTEAITYVMDDPAHAVAVGKKHGVIILPPDADNLIPHYPGFGAKREMLEE